MCGKQVQTGMGGPVRQFLVSGKGIVHLLNFMRLRQNRLPEITAVTCSMLSVLPSIASDA